MMSIPIRSLAIASLLGDAGERAQQRYEKPTKPDAFTLAAGAHEIHAVIPVAGAHQQQAALAEVESLEQRAHTMLVERS